VLPPNDLALMEGDEILFCMKPQHKVLLEANLVNAYTLDYLLTGVEPARGAFFRWLEARHAAN